MAMLRRSWRWLVLVLVTLVPRLYLLRVYDIELSQDGFEAVKTLAILQAQGASAVPRDLVDRFILHPSYMLLLYVLRWLTPASLDFYLAARLLSTVLACVAVVLLFQFTRRAFGEVAAWVGALLLAFAPTFLWESLAILSSTLFLALYVAVLFALCESRYRLAALLALVAALTRYEGAVLIGLVLIALFIRDRRARQFGRSDWAVAGALALAFPLTLVVAGALATGNALEFVGAQSMASIWLRFLAPGDFFKRGAFFVTQYSALFPSPVVWLGLAGVLLALLRLRTRATALLLGTGALYWVFFEVLVWFNYTTLETRFLMYPGLPLLVFAGVAIKWAAQLAGERGRLALAGPVLALAVLALVWMSYAQSIPGLEYVYHMMASQEQVADELVQLIPPNQTTHLLSYTGNAGALDFYARQRGLQLDYVDFRFAPDDHPEQFVIDHHIQFVVYPVGNAFAKAKYPYLARFETQTQGGVTFQPLTQFATTLDDQMYSIWRVQW